MPDRLLPIRLALGRSPLALGCVVFLAALVAMFVIGGELFFGEPLYEMGDLAANALQIDRAKEFRELYGNYSRFGFHHPGPAFFYVYAGAEIAFHDALGLSPAPHNAHLLGAALLQSGFLAVTITVLSRFAAPNRLFFAALALTIAIVHFAMAGQQHYSIWPPSALVIPFAAFLALAVGLSRGVLGLLPLLVMVGGFLVHGHVAQPLFVVPMGAIAYVAGIRHRTATDRQGPGSAIRRAVMPHVATVLVLAIFLAPIAIDAFRGPPFNLGLILQTLTAPREPADAHGAWSVAAYLGAFMAYPSAGELNFTPQSFVDLLAHSWVTVVVVALFAAGLPLAYVLRSHRRDAPAGGLQSSDAAREGITGIWIVTALAIGLSAVWVYMQRGPLYQFNSFFIYGLMYVTMLATAIAAARLLPAQAVHAGTLLMTMLALVVSLNLSPPRNLGEPPTIAQSTARVVRSTPAPNGVLLEFDGMHWNAPAAVALALERLGIPWYVAPHWGLIFGYDQTYPAPGQPEPLVWHLVPPNSGPDEIMLSPAVAISAPLASEASSK